MTTTVFVNGVTLTDEAWFNDTNAVTYDGTTSQILVGGGAGATPIWTTATGSGSPVRAVSPDLTSIPTAPTASLGTSTTQLATTAFAIANGLKIKAGTTTRDMTAATGTVDITGIGFTPSVVILFAGVTGTSMISLGFDDVTTRMTIADTNSTSANNHTVSTGQSIYLIYGAGAYQFATISAMASDQFTLSWTKSGTPTGTASIGYIAIGT